MKRLLKLMCVVAVAMAAAACAKYELSPVEGPGAVRTITIGFDATKTTISDEGVTLWAEGDSLWVSNGSANEVWHVPAESVGKETFTVQTALPGKLKVVYPYSAVKGLTEDGKYLLTIPATVEGSSFAKANIAVAEVESAATEEEQADVKVKMKNVTGVMKFSISESAMYPPKAVGLSAPGSILAGDITVDMSTGVPQVTAQGGSSMILITGTEGGGTFYAAVVPGELKEGFRYIGVGVDLDCESISSTKANVIRPNDMVNLGQFGTRELKPLEGEGTEGSPYLIHNLPEYLAFSYYVNESPENTMEGKYIKVTEDIDGITMPVGKYDETDFYFCGNFDGGGHTFTLNINGGDYSAMFGEVGAGANIHDVNVAGTVVGKSSAAGVAGCINAGKGVTFFRNCTNNASVTGTTNSGGIAGYADSGWGATSKTDTSGLHFVNCVNHGAVVATGNNAAGICGQTSAAFNKEFLECSNTGSVTANNSVGGIVGYGYYCIVTSCSNSGAIEGTNSASTGMYGLDGSSFKFVSGYNTGVGGIIGWAQNCNTIAECSNTATVTGPNKVGGIAGVIYWTGVSKSTNTAQITGKYTTTKGINFGAATGGIVGWVVNRYNVDDCTNSGRIVAPGGCGGIVGVCMPQTSDIVYVRRCENTGEVDGSAGECAGGICGIGWNQAGAKYVKAMNSVNKGNVVAKNSAGGIYGQMYDANNAKQGYADMCSNEGKISANYYAGGIVGYCKTRATGPAWYVRNCENHGDVYALRTDAQPSYTGGLVGAVHAYGTGLVLSNSYNTGKVFYTNTTYANPCVGGICGNFTKGTMQNVYNSGAVGFVGEKPEEEVAYTTVGSVAGGVGGTIKNAYWLVGTYDAALGTAAASTDPTVVSYTEGGELSEPVLVGETNCTDLLTALNAWVGESTTYIKWTAGPKFVQE